MTLDLARQQIKLIKNINVPIVTYSRSNEHRSIGTHSKFFLESNMTRKCNFNETKSLFWNVLPFLFYYSFYAAVVWKEVMFTLNKLDRISLKLHKDKNIIFFVFV